MLEMVTMAIVLIAWMLKKISSNHNIIVRLHQENSQFAVNLTSLTSWNQLELNHNLSNCLLVPKNYANLNILSIWPNTKSHHSLFYNQKLLQLQILQIWFRFKYFMQFFQTNQQTALVSKLFWSGKDSNYFLYDSFDESLEIYKSHFALMNTNNLPSP